MQRRVVLVSAPGAFSVIPEPHHQYFARGLQGADRSGLDPEIGAVSPPEVLVNATLIVPEAGCDVPIPCLVEASPAPQSENLCTLVKRSRKAHFGLGCCVVLFVGLIAALAIALMANMKYEGNGEDDAYLFSNSSKYGKHGTGASPATAAPTVVVTTNSLNTMMPALATAAFTVVTTSLNTMLPAPVPAATVPVSAIGTDDDDEEKEEDEYEYESESHD
jgi:hypothetical protein